MDGPNLASADPIAIKIDSFAVNELENPCLRGEVAAVGGQAR